MDPRVIGYPHVTQFETRMRRAAAPTDGGDERKGPPGVRPERRRLVAAALAAALVSFLFVTSYVFVLRDPRPSELPVGAVAPDAGLAPVRTIVGRELGDAFALDPYPDERAARAAIDRRDVYGTLVVTDGEVRALTAEAAGPAAKEAVTRLAQSLARTSGRTAVIEEVRPLPRGDARGLGPFLFQLGLLLPSFAFAIALFALARGGSVGARLAALGVFAVLVGLLAAAAIDPLLGALTGNFWALVGVGTLFAAAVSLATAGFHAVAGRPGAALAAAALVLFGNAAAAGALPREFLPEVYRQLGSWFPSSASVTAIRNSVYFDGNALLQPTVVLAAWAAAGLLALGAVSLARARSRHPASHGTGADLTGLDTVGREQRPR